MHDYWRWFASTPSAWWHDSGNPEEIKKAVSNGAQGVTTNPVLTYKTFQERPDFWREKIQSIPADLPHAKRAEELLKLVALYAAGEVRDLYDKTGGVHGYALGQLNPNNAGNAEAMLEQSYTVDNWGENIIAKMPTSKAGIQVMEKLGAEGINVCATVNVTVAQAVTVAERYEAAARKAIAAGKKPGFCIVVQQVGRVEDYVRLLSAEGDYGLTEDDIDMAGIAMAKRTIELLPREKYPHCVVMPGGLRTPQQLAELAGADVIFTLHPRFQLLVESADLPREVLAGRPMPKDRIERLLRMPEYRKLYEPDGLKEEEFLSFGCAQKVLSHFLESGWARLETHGLDNTLSDHWT